MNFKNIKKILTILSIVLGIGQSSIAQNMVLTSDADLTQMKREAIESKKGFFVVLVSVQDADYSNELVSSIQGTFRGESKLQDLYQGYVMDGFANMEIAQKYDITNFPALLVFNSQGQNIGMNDQLTCASDVWATLSDKKSSAITIGENNEVAMEDLFYLNKSRGEHDQESVINIIKGYEKQSYKQMETRGFGIKIGTFLSFEAFEAEMSVYAKKWAKEDIMVYSQLISGIEAYSIVLGNYTYIEEAKVVQKNIRSSFFNTTTRVIDLNHIAK